jgi:hypothetical protein
MGAWCAGQFYLYKLDYRRFSSMPFSISLDFAAKGPHYEISPILPLSVRRSSIWEMAIDRQRSDIVFWWDDDVGDDY